MQLKRMVVVKRTARMGILSLAFWALELLMRGVWLELGFAIMTDD